MVSCSGFGLPLHAQLLRLFVTRLGSETVKYVHGKTLSYTSMVCSVNSSLCNILQRIQAPTRCRPLDRAVAVCDQLLVIVLVRVKKSTAALPYMFRSPVHQKSFTVTDSCRCILAVRLTRSHIDVAHAGHFTSMGSVQASAGGTL